MKYVVQVEGHSIEVEVDGERITVAGQPYHAAFRQIPGTPLRQLLLNNRPVILSIEPLGQGRWALARAGERFEVEVLDERARHIRSLAATGDQRRKAEVLRAPMPGMVVRIDARPGETVSAGAGLVVLEAMKMENELKAAAGGRVKAVRVNPGEAVEKGQVLVEFDSEPALTQS
jgi:biotin carboxyl carrier protein